MPFFPSWQYINTGARSGQVNMDVDVALAHALAGGSGHPTLRVYGWNPPAISLGFHQPMDEIDLAHAAADGISVVRRPTGGRAILHADELTYSIVMKVRNKSIASVYDEICRGLTAGLELLSVPAAMEQAQPHFPSLYKEEGAGLCFSSSARYEVKVDGRKLAGSAQRRYVCEDGDEVVLQHGSLMLGARHKDLVEYLTPSGQESKRRLRTILDTRTTELGSVLGREVSFDETAEAIRQGFERAWGIRFEPADLLPELSRTAAAVGMAGNVF